MAQRDIIEINEEKCDGCGQCVTGCAEGALAIVDGKARLISDVYCDGLGACLEECPQGALNIIKREAPEFDEEAVEAHLKRQEAAPAPSPEPLACGCPGSQVQSLQAKPASGGPSAPSALTNWPIQLHLAPPKAPFFENAHLLIAADCAGFSAANLHRDHLPGKTLIIACPKLDETSGYIDKLAQIFARNNVKSINVLYMTVPCCAGLAYMVGEAVKKSGRDDLETRLTKIDPSGAVIEETQVKAA